MLKKLAVICTCLCSMLLFGESAASAKYRIATIVAVSPHAATAGADSSVPSYDVSVQIGNTVYVVLYTPRLAQQTVKYAAGRQVLVRVGETSMTYNDISGTEIESPILARKTVAPAASR